MKRNYINRINLLVGFLLCYTINCTAQDSTKKDLLLNIGYYQINNKVMYLMVNTKTKINSKFQPAPNQNVTLYLDSIAETNLISKIKTDEKGTAKVILPVQLKNTWQAASNHTFIGVTESTDQFNKTNAETSVTIAKVSIDTSTEGKTKNIIATVSVLKNNVWLPAKAVEMKVGVSRIGGILSAGDEPTYTTDSTGSVTVQLKKDSLPGDQKGNIKLVVKVEDNDQYGNLLVEKTVPWGIAVKAQNNFFNQRTLWSTRFKTPIWLLIIAYSLGIGVWSIIIYLIFQIIKIKKLGSKSFSSTSAEENISRKSEVKIQLSK